MPASRPYARCLLLAIGCLLCVPGVASGDYEFGSTVTKLGETEQPVFTDPPSECLDGQLFEDVPPRAFRDSLNRVQLIISHAGAPPSTTGHTRRLISQPGESLADIDNDDLNCTVIHASHAKSDPSTFENAEWITSPYTEDGSTIYALVHNEYHGNEYGQCAGTAPIGSDGKPRCWYNSITLAKSEPSADPGSSYTREPLTQQDHLVASIPYQYEPDKHAYGYFQPSNIIKKGSWYYSLIRTGEDTYLAQQPRSCVMRTQNLDDPGSWRGYDGDATNDGQEGFTVSFANPYDHLEDPEFDAAEHVCASISTHALSGNLVYSTYFGRYMIVARDFINGTEGVFYSLSKDLIHWDDPRLLMEAPSPPNCSGKIPIRHPAVIDSSSTDRNFSTVGQTADLYYVKFSCPNQLDRDLVRRPIRFQSDHSRFAVGGYFGCPGGFDSLMHQPGPSGSYFLPSMDRNYMGLPASYKADKTLGGATAYGILDKHANPVTCEFNYEDIRGPLAYGEGDDVSYSGAFVFPSNEFFNQIGANSNVTFMRLDTGASGWAGALVINKNRLVRFNTNVNGTTHQFLANGFTLPNDNCWHHFDIHQKLSSNQAQAQTRIWIDYQEKTVTNAPNFPSGSTGPYRQVRAGIVTTFGSSNVILYTDAVAVRPGSNQPLWYGGCNDPPQ